MELALCNTALFMAQAQEIWFGIWENVILSFLKEAVRRRVQPNDDMSSVFT
jgi:hypothetical protein